LLILTGNNNYTGGTVLTGGTLNLGSANAIGSTGLINFAGGTLQFSDANTTDYSARFSTANNQAYKIDTNGKDISFASALNSTTSTLSKQGEGTLTLTNASRFASSAVGATTIQAGTLALRVANPTAIDAAAVFSGAGTLAIENSNANSATGFTNAVTLSSDLLFNTGGSSLGGLTIGRRGNTADLLLDALPSGLSVTGSQSYYGGTVTIPVNANANIVTRNNAGLLTLSAQTDVSILSSVRITGTGGVAIETSQNSATGGTGNYSLGVSSGGFSGSVTFVNPTAVDTNGVTVANETFTTQDGSTSSNKKTYTLISSLTALKNASTSANLALTGDLNATSFFITNADASTTRYGNVMSGT
jgi:autotransporter-associated beta strand protein